MVLKGFLNKIVGTSEACGFKVVLEDFQKHVQRELLYLKLFSNILTQIVIELR